MMSFKEANELFIYDENTGVLYWKKCVGHVRAGAVAGSTRPDGYISVTVNSKKYFAHRIVWLIMTGNWPISQIDHEDQVRANNRFSNLREADFVINAKNKKLYSSNTSGTVGVYWRPRRKKWAAFIKNEGRDRHLGYFVIKADAISVRKAAEVELGYHPNHGRSLILNGEPT